MNTFETVRLPLLQVREERMNLDNQTLSMERELKVYGEPALVPCQSRAASKEESL